MKTRISIVLPRLLGAVLAGLILPAKLALAHLELHPTREIRKSSCSNCK
jgi:hypothetical protein